MNGNPVNVTEEQLLAFVEECLPLPEKSGTGTKRAQPDDSLAASQDTPTKDKFEAQLEVSPPMKKIHSSS
jgi:hypothetical protein